MATYQFSHLSPSKNNPSANINRTFDQLPSNFSTYLLEDYTFLNEYQLLDSPINTETQFLAQIKSTRQLVKFIKKPYTTTTAPKGLNMYKRFEAMFSMFQKGLILADNMFILQQANNTFFYYIIEPYLNSSEPTIDMPFATLQQYLLQNKQNIQGFEQRKVLFIKCKNLIDCLAQSGQTYCGLNTRKIVIDDEGNTFLMPYSLQFTILNKPYERSYYPIEVIKHLLTKETKEPLKCLQKWDIWSFGCIAIEIFLYLTPFFMSTSVQTQIAKIKRDRNQIIQDFKIQFMEMLQRQAQLHSESECSINDHFYAEMKEVTKIINFLMNVFNVEETKRVISFEPSQQKLDFCDEKTTRTRRFVKKYQKKRGQKVQNKIRAFRKDQKTNALTSRCLISKFSSLRNNKQNYKEINILEDNKNKTHINEEEKYEFEILFKSFIIQELPTGMKGEVELFVQFSNAQKFKFFIDMPKKEETTDTFEAIINKKITFSKKSFGFFEDLLNEDVMVTVNSSKSSNDDKCCILIGLSALTIKNEENSRVWKKPIKGTYNSQPENYISCKVKIEARLTDLKEAQKSQRETSGKKIMLKGQSAIESVQQAQQTSRFPQPLSENKSLTNSVNFGVKNKENSMKPIDLSKKLKKLLMV